MDSRNLQPRPRAIPGVQAGASGPGLPHIPLPGKRALLQGAVWRPPVACAMVCRRCWRCQLESRELKQLNKQIPEHPPRPSGEDLPGKPSDLPFQPAVIPESGLSFRKD